MSPSLRLLVVPVTALASLAIVLFLPAALPEVSSGRLGNKVVQRFLDAELGHAKLSKKLPRLSSGVMYSALEAGRGRMQRGASHPAASSSTAHTQGCSDTAALGNRQNIRVNQDCSLRRQAEEVVAVNPRNANNLVAGQNDSRIGWNHCGYDWSLDRGTTWGDMIPPFYQYILSDGHTADVCSDPTATFDSQGNAYIGGIIWDIISPANALVVAKSNAGINGTFFHSPAADDPDNGIVGFQTYRDLPLGVIADDSDGCIFHDKQYIVADQNPRSPRRDAVYMTWTYFDVCTEAGVGFNSPIYFSQSTDGGATWSPGIEISGASSSLCTAASGEGDANACDQDQGSHPVVGPDGTVYVAFGNGNTSTVGVNQHLIVLCLASRDCTSPSGWQGPYKIVDDLGTQPYNNGNDPDSKGCDPGRQCLPPNGYRLDDFVEGSLAVDISGRLYFTWADFRNAQGSSCDTGDTATATPPCDNDVFYVWSTTGGQQWSTPVDVSSPNEGSTKSAQWQPWSAVTVQGNTLFIAYYDRHFGNCEGSGCNDITLATVTNPSPALGKRAIGYQRLTTSSMPNLTPDNNPVQQGFLGDYMWVTTDLQGHPYVVWADTRGKHADGSVIEEDVFFARPGQ